MIEKGKLFVITHACYDDLSVWYLYRAKMDLDRDKLIDEFCEGKQQFNNSGCRKEKYERNYSLWCAEEFVEWLEEKGYVEKVECNELELEC